MLERLAKATTTYGGVGSSLRNGAPPRDARPSSPTVTILLVDDEITRLGIRAALSAEKGLALIGESETIAEALAQASRLRPTIVITGGTLPDGTGLEICRRLQASAPYTRVIVLARDVNSASVVEAVRAGAAGYFAKRISRNDLCRAVKAVAAGELLIDPTSTRLLLDGIRHGITPGSQSETTPLTVQERRVLALVVQGKTNKEIALELSLSDKTVKNYLSHAFEKLNVSRRAQAAVLFAQLTDRLRAAS